MDDDAHQALLHLFPIHTHTLLLFGNEYGTVTLKILLLLKKKRCQSVKYDIRISSLFFFLQPQI